MKTIIEELREEKNKLIAEGQLPKWFTTGGWQTVKGKYLYKDERGMRDVWDRVSRTASKHLPEDLQEKAYNKFFNLFWNGWLAGATPVLTNMGTDRGCPVSCSGNYTADQIGGESGFYGSLQENAVLSKNGFGTSTYLGDIRERGANFGDKGKASGLLPVFKDGITMAKNVSQGSNRRGAIAQYVPICHPDFWELVKYVELNPDDVNIGWTFSKEFIAKLESGNQDAVERYQAMMKLRCLTGKGYIFKNEQANNDNPKSWLEAGLRVKASNLCTEIMLIANKDYSFTCVLSSMNASKYDEWKNTDSVYWATTFLDCVASEFVSYCKKDDELKVDLRKAIAFTENSRALGLGCLGFHTYLQKKGVPFESLQAQFINDEIFKHIHDESLRASKYLAELLGEPEWMKGTGLRNTHRCVSGDTKILTREGNLPIKELVGKKVDVWNGKEWSEVEPFQTGKNDEMLEITFSNGRKLKTTLDHKFLVTSPKRSNSLYLGDHILNEVEAKDLRIKDCMPKFYGAVSDSENMPKLKHAYTNGAFSGDGSINHSKKGKYPRNEIRLYDDKINMADRLEFKSKKLWDVKINGKVRGKRGYLTEKLEPKYFVPVNYNLESRIEWLAGIIDTDGSCNAKGISISTKHEKFADDIMELLLTLGCFGHKSKTKGKGIVNIIDKDYKRSDLYSINISSIECQTLKELGMVLSRTKFPKECVNNSLNKLSKKQFVEVTSIRKVKNEDSFCFTEKINGTGVFNGILTKQCAIAPNTSSALICGAVSQGIEPVVANVWNQRSAAGEIARISPILLQLLKDKGEYKESVLKSIREAYGSVQHLDFLSDEEKMVFKTAYEIDQSVVVRLASLRQKYICQGQSLNLFFSADEDEAVISAVHKQAILDKRLKSLYYLRTMAGVQASNGECLSCHG